MSLSGVRARACLMFSQIAVPTQNLKPSRTALFLQSTVKLLSCYVRSAHELSAVGIAAPIDVVDGQESQFSFSTASAQPPIRRNYFLLNAKTHSFMSFAILLTAFLAALASLTFGERYSANDALSGSDLLLSPGLAVLGITHTFRITHVVTVTQQGK